MYALPLPTHTLLRSKPFTLPLPIPTSSEYLSAGAEATAPQSRRPPALGHFLPTHLRYLPATPAHALPPSPLAQIRCPYPDGASGKMEDGGHVCVQEADCERVRAMRKEGAKFSLKAFK